MSISVMQSNIDLVLGFKDRAFAFIILITVILVSLLRLMS